MSTGELFIVEKDMPAYISGYDNQSHKVIGNRQVIIAKGEIVEFRYSYGVHFRTRDDKYFYVDGKVFNEHCKPYGNVWEKVRWINKANLDEILRLNLYHEIKKG